MILVVQAEIAQHFYFPCCELLPLYVCFQFVHHDQVHADLYAFQLPSRQMKLNQPIYLINQIQLSIYVCVYYQRDYPEGKAWVVLYPEQSLLVYLDEMVDFLLQGELHVVRQDGAQFLMELCVWEETILEFDKCILLFHWNKFILRYAPLSDHYPFNIRSLSIIRSSLSLYYRLSDHSFLFFNAGFHVLHLFIHDFAVVYEDLQILFSLVLDGIFLIAVFHQILQPIVEHCAFFNCMIAHPMITQRNPFGSRYITLIAFEVQEVLTLFEHPHLLVLLFLREILLLDPLLDGCLQFLVLDGLPPEPNFLSFLEHFGLHSLEGGGLVGYIFIGQPEVEGELQRFILIQFVHKYFYELQGYTTRNILVNSNHSIKNYQFTLLILLNIYRIFSSTDIAFTIRALLLTFFNNLVSKSIVYSGLSIYGQKFIMFYQIRLLWELLGVFYAIICFFSNNYFFCDFMISSFMSNYFSYLRILSYKDLFLFSLRLSMIFFYASYLLSFYSFYAYAV